MIRHEDAAGAGQGWGTRFLSGTPPGRGFSLVSTLKVSFAPWTWAGHIPASAHADLRPLLVQRSNCLGLEN